MEPKIVPGKDMAGIHYFDSVESVMEMATGCSAANTEHYMFTEKRNNSQKLGLGSSDLVRAAIRDGWPEGVARTMAAFDGLHVEPVPTDMRRRKLRSDQGDWLDMQAVYSGNLSKAWTRTARARRVASRTITLLVDLAITWETPGDVLFWRGAAALFLSDVLTKSGYSVGIIACNAGFIDVATSPKFAHLITVKQPDMPLNLDNLAATICLPGFFRLPCFQLLRNDQRHIDSSLSQPRDFRTVYPDEAESMNAVDNFASIHDAVSASEYVELAIDQLMNESMAA